MEAPSANLACRKCRSHRVKCDRSKPACGRCQRTHHVCTYPVKNAAVAYVLYVEELEMEIAKLENQLKHLGIDVLHENHTNQGEPIIVGSPSSPGPLEDHNLIRDLFAPMATPGEGDEQVQEIVSHVTQGPLAAATSQSPTITRDRVLHLLILGAARPKIVQDQSQALPSLAISQRVLNKYCSSVLPMLPFIKTNSLQTHILQAFEHSAPYSIFITASLLATTAIFISPGSADNACHLHFTALSALEVAFAAQVDEEPLQTLEAVIALAQFARLAGSAYSDAWALAGIAVRIVVDLGLHKLCRTDRERRLFWCAHTLDKGIADSRGLPPGLADATIEVSFPDTPHLFNTDQMEKL